VKANYPNNLLIEQYLAGTLDPKQMHVLEKQALDDPFLADALEGYARNTHTGHDLSILQRQLHERIMLLQENKKVFDFTWQRLSVAAAAAVLFISAGILFWMKFEKHEVQTASNDKQVETALTPIDSLNKMRNLPYKEKQIEPESNSSISTAILKPASENRARAPKKQYNVQLPAKKLFPEFVKSNDKIADNEPALISAAPAPSTATDDISSALQGRASGVAVTQNKSTVLDEVVVVGYATQRKKDITGSVTTVEAKDFVGYTLSGKIVSKADGEPLPGVAIKDKLSNKTTSTNAKGEFNLYLDSVAANLVVTYIGFNAAEIKAKAGQDLKISLTESTSALNEVVVVGYGTRTDAEDRSEAKIIYAEPVAGWKAYTKYMSANVKHPFGEAIQTGKVKISFDVDYAGNLSNFIVLKGLSEKYNNEAIKLIQDGPKWNSAGNPNAKGFVTITFRKP
jgi:hypothetical protein